MKKIFNTIGLVACCAAVFATATANAQDEKLTIMSSQGWITEAEEELGAAFEKETGIAVDYQIIPADQYYNVLLARLNTGEGPDIFGGQSGYSDLLSYKVEENAIDLSDQPWAERLDPLVAATSSLGDKLYGLTYWDTVGNTWVMNYNIALFEEHNVAVPTNYNELRSACETFSEAGITPMYEPFADGWHHVLMFAEMGPNYASNSDGLVEALNANTTTLAENETMQTTLTQINELYQSGCFGDDALSDQFSGMTKAFTSNETAMVYAQMSFYGAVQNDFPDYDISNIGLFVPPFGDSQFINMNPAGPTKFVYSGGDNQEAALQYLDFLTRPENAAAYIAHPAGAKNLPFNDAKGGFPENVLSFLDANSDNRGIVLQTSVNYVNPQWMDIGQDMTAMVTGQIKPERVLSNIDKRRANVAKAAGDEGWK